MRTHVHICSLLALACPLWFGACSKGGDGHDAAAAPPEQPEQPEPEQQPARPAETPGGQPGVARPEPLRKIPTLEDRSGEAPLADVFALADPNADAAWTSEALGDAINKGLKALAHAFEEADWEDEAFLAALADAGAKCNALRPATEEAFADGALRVRREKAAAGDADPDRDLATELAALRAAYAADGEVRVKFKVVGVTMPDGGGTAGSEAVLEIVGDGATGGERLNHSAIWETRWQVPEGDRKHPRLVELRSSRFEEVVADGELFRDATQALLGDQPAFTDQLIHGADYWYGNLDVSFGIHQGNQGLAIGDADGDGREDLLVCQPAGLPLRFFLREADGTLRGAAAEAGLDWLDNARSALFVDLDNDADQDLLLTLNYSLVVFENSGGAEFARRAVIDIHSWPSSIAAADYDLDGDLDVYVCGYNPRGETAPGDIFANPVPYHDAENGARNFFLENGGGFRFEDVTGRVGLNTKNHRFSFAASWEDYDDDGDPDLYVANDFGRNNLYRNDGDKDGARQFVEVGPEAGVEDIAAGMSVSWGDYDGDGLVDLYTSNMFSAAGNRVTGQGQFKAGADAADRAAMRRHARGNTLYRNRGDGTFEDVSEACGVTLGRWAWGSHFTDFNNDGRQDLYVANGFFTTPDSGDL